MANRVIRSVLVSTTCVFMGFSGASAASAEEAPKAKIAATEDTGEIIVTAQKRDEKAQNVPISIAAFSGATLIKQNVIAVTDLAKIAPNFSANVNNQSAGIRLSIRGIGAPGNTATEPSVATFVDGVYVPRPGAIIGSFLDMEGLEVLRGPQGTLFGRNASVGALSLHTATPKRDLSASVTGEIGNGDRYKVSGYINAPLTNNISLRVAGLGQWFGGYWHNQLDGKQYGGMDDVATRATLKGDFGKLTWIIRGDYSRSSGDGVTNQGFEANSVSAAQLAAFKARLGGTLPNTNLFDGNINQYITAGLTDKQWGVSSDLSLDVGEYKLRLIDSYRKWDNYQLDGDVVFTPAQLSSRASTYSSTSNNHELQFISPKDKLLGGALDFVAGLYYFQEDFGISEKLQLNSQFCSTLVPPKQQPACNATYAAGGGVNATDQEFAQSVTSYAAYGQATFKIADPLHLTLGGRWTRDEKNATYIQLLNNPFAASLRAPENDVLADSESKFTWRGSLNYKPNKNILLFANYSTGYKSGGFNSGGGAVNLGQKRIFGSETTTNYELGAKTSWLGGALRANATLFRMDIAGYQDRSFDGVSFVVNNAGNLRQQGLEFDTVLTPDRHFSVTAAMAYLDSQFTSYPNATGLPGLGGTQNLAGASATYSPKYTVSVTPELKSNIESSGMHWSLTSTLSMTSSYYNGSVTDNNIQTLQQGYVLLGARLSIFGAKDRWSLAAFGNNLTNQGYCINQSYQTLDSAFGLRNGIFSGSTAVRCLQSAPRTYGMSATVKF